MHRGVRSVAGPWWRLSIIAVVLLALGGALRPPRAAARDLYVSDSESASLSVLETATNQLFGEPIAVGGGPTGVAITPDGRFAYVADSGAGTVSVVDLETGFAAAPIQVPPGPAAIAISPDGRFAFVTSTKSQTVSVIDTQTNQLAGEPIKVGAGPEGIAISPGGNSAYVADQGDGSVLVIDTQTRQVVGEPIQVGAAPAGVAFSPDGGFVYVTDQSGSAVSVIDTHTRSVESAIGVPDEPRAIAVSPDGKLAYVTQQGSEAVSVIDTQTGRVLGAPIAVGKKPEGIAITPDGKIAYVTNFESADISAIDTQTGRPLGAPIGTASFPADAAIVPDQPPHASFAVPSGRPAVPLGFDAAASRDPDGSIARYEWSFGDGGTLTSGGATPRHTYRKPGDYKVTLTLVDDEGCSTSIISTGQTAYCNGSPGATQTQAVKITYPGVRLRCPRRAGRRGCHFRLQILSRRRRGRAESAITKAKIKAGASAVVALKPRRAYALSLATASMALVKEKLAIKGLTRTRFVRLELLG